MWSAFLNKASHTFFYFFSAYVDECHLESEKNEHLLEALESVDHGMQQSKSNGFFFQFESLVLLILLYLLSQSEASRDPWIVSLLPMVKLGLVLAFAFCFWTGVVVMKTDENNFLGIKLNIANVIKNSKIKM